MCLLHTQIYKFLSHEKWSPHTLYHAHSHTHIHKLFSHEKWSPHNLCVVINYLINCIPFALPNFYSFIGLKKDIFPFQPPKICLSILLVCGVRIVLSSMGTHIFDTNNSKHRSIYMVLTYIDAYVVLRSNWNYFLLFLGGRHHR